MWFDSGVVESVANATPPWLLVALVVLSFLGSATLLTPLVIGRYWVVRDERAATWLGIVFGGYAARSLVKKLNSIDRPAVEPPLDPAAFPAPIRPLYEHPAEIATTAFPSGHVVAAVAVWGLFVVDSRRASRRTRLAIAAAVVAVVGVSRIAVGAHYVGDVVGGLALGLAVLGAGLFVRERTAEPVGATLALAGLVAAGILTVSPSSTGEGVLGASVGMLAAWYRPSLRAALLAPRSCTDRDRYVGGGTILLGLLAAGIVLANGHSIAHVGAAAGGGAVLIAVGRSRTLAGRLASIGRRSTP